MDSSAGAVPTPTTTRIHRRALVLAAALFALFMIAAGLYARFGYAVVLRVYEEQQVANAALRVGSGKIVELGDYLRVDPANLRVRGLLVNQWIEFKDPPRALEAARAGIAAAALDQRPIVMLLVARAQIAGGALDDAAKTYGEVLAAVGDSGEAHYGLAHIAAARGSLKKMREEFGRCISKHFENTKSVDLGPFTLFVSSQQIYPIRSSNNTPDFDYRLGSSPGRFTGSKTLDLDYLFIGDINTVFTRLASLDNFDDTPPAALFWRGVYEEEQGHRNVALDFYKRAADGGDALGAFAFARLSRPAATESG